jgi:hypothetical protein
VLIQTARAVRSPRRQREREAAATTLRLARPAAWQSAREPVTLTEPVDWAAVLKLAACHRVTPLVAQSLAARPGLAPGWVQQTLLLRVREDGVAGLAQEVELRRVLRTLTAAAVDVLVLKGPAVAHTVYPRPDLRPYGDLDLFCRAADYDRLYRALTAAGYVPDAGAQTLRPTRSAIEGYDERGFSSATRQVHIEVHCSLLEFGMTERHQGAFWGQAESLHSDVVTMRILAPAHQFLHLAAHLHRHAYERLIWLIDLDLFIRRYGALIDWRAVMRTARDEGVGSVVRHVVWVLHALLGTPRPDLGPPTREEALLSHLYRLLWPIAGIRRLAGVAHLRLVRFDPATGHPLDVVPALVLLGRRREKLRALRRYAGSSAI